jgi:hypothetical protein
VPRDASSGFRGRRLLGRLASLWWIRVVAVWAAARLLVWTVAVAAVASSSRAGELARPDWPLLVFSRWDAKYYIAVAAHGYFAGGVPARAVAFFPGLPMLGRWVVDAAGWGSEPPLDAIRAALLVVVTAASAIAALLLWRIADERGGPRLALAAVAIVVFGPYAMVLTAPYSEPVFLALALGAWSAASRGRWLVAGSLVAAASLVRVNGLFLALAVGAYVATTLRSAGRPWVRRAVATTLLGISGVAAYFLYLWWCTGDPLAWSAAEFGGWGRVTSWPWVSLGNTVGQILAAPTSLPHRFQGTLDLLFAALVVIGIVVLARRRRWPELVMVAATAAAMMTSTTYLSLARDTILLFPLWIEFAALASRTPGRRLYGLGLGVGVLLLVVDTSCFVQGVWAD